MAVFLFYGQEEYLMDKEIKRLKNELLDPSFISMAYKVFDNPEFVDLMDCLQAAPLMFGKTLSIININKYLVGNKLSLDDKQIESINFALENINDNVNVILVCKIGRDETKKVDTRKKLYKTLAKHSQTREFTQYRTYDKELSAVISTIAKEKELTISSDCISLIIEQIGVNLTLIDSELEKLKLAVHPTNKITSDAIKKYCISSDDIFTLSDLIIKGDKNEVLKQYNLLVEKTHPLQIFAILQGNFKRYIFIKSYEKMMSEKDLASKLKVHEYIVKLTKEKLRKTSLERLIEIRKNLISAELKTKTGQFKAEELALELAILS